MIFQLIKAPALLSLHNSFEKLLDALLFTFDMVGRGWETKSNLEREEREEL